MLSPEDIKKHFPHAQNIIVIRHGLIKSTRGGRNERGATKCVFMEIGILYEAIIEWTDNIESSRKDTEMLIAKNRISRGTYDLLVANKTSKFEKIRLEDNGVPII